MKNKIWFITGISSGLGEALAQTVIEQGDFVIGTFRRKSQADAFNNLHKNKAFALTLDITNPIEIEYVFEIVKEKFGKIDVLINNAGFGFAGAIEETSVKEVREVFEANFFGTLQVTQAALPIFRKQKYGHIIQISSHGGFKAFQGFGIYNASKFALEGFSEALAIEVEPLGIKVTIVEPGPFRTNFVGNAFKEAEAVITDYNETAGEFRKRMKAVDGKQEGDPLRAAEAILAISNLENPPLRLPLGKIAIASITAKINSVIKDLNEFRTVAENAVYE
ncbi:short-chain dehydrogenase/reductase [Pedobacter psychrophilus]|uniref:Short-chain dehydrogenase/reductase n=1 Tax=Pedobacter psychrophilus TaxID=1826909 RepID=A0A179DFI5_9SPHI|nr:oxidoreductase [Pedobacter psychrophilus]OAQ39806.1 short-chain dehydrogenase/reductase [Pedobacter psychrophilus]